jgi:hypothetical protein
LHDAGAIAPDAALLLSSLLYCGCLIAACLMEPSRLRSIVPSCLYIYRRVLTNDVPFAACSLHVLLKHAGAIAPDAALLLSSLLCYGCLIAACRSWSRVITAQHRRT